MGRIMFVCSCNALTDRDVEAAVDDGATQPREIYAARGCRAQCGNCVSGMLCLLRRAIQERAEAAMREATAMMEGGAPA
jgi:bacterioferritin-associated ferredoxin